MAETFDAARSEPEPRPGRTEVLPLVIADLEARAAAGLEKYGTRLEVENGRDHLVDAYQEAIDLVMYLRAEIEARHQVELEVAEQTFQAGLDFLEELGK